MKWCVKKIILHLGANGSHEEWKDTTEKPKYNISTLKELRISDIVKYVKKCKQNEKLGLTFKNDDITWEMWPGGQVNEANE